MFKQAAMVTSVVILGVLTLLAGSFTVVLALKMCPTLLYLSLGLCLTLLMGQLVRTIAGMLLGN